MKAKKPIKNLIVSVSVFSVAFALSILFQKIGVEEHITTIFVFAVFLISLLTDGYAFGVLAAVAGMFATNYVFTYPYFAFDFITPVNLISAVIMILLSLITSTLTTKIKLHEAARAEGEREKMRANLLRAVSHDLRTPLTTISSASATLQNKSSALTAEQQQLMLKNIQENSDWLIRMVENLLSVTRLDSGAVKIVKAPTIVDELIDSAITKFSVRHPKQCVNTDICDELTVVSVDAILIEQVLLNLLENAVYHARSMTELSVRVFTLGNQAIFEVADNGCGIPEDKLKQLFKGEYGFKQDTSADKNRFAGIGLAVCSTIIKAHNGEIFAENRKNGGALFRFTLQREEFSDGE